LRHSPRFKDLEVAVNQIQATLRPEELCHVHWPVGAIREFELPKNEERVAFQRLQA
jgi:hypothetical protein